MKILHVSTNYKPVGERIGHGGVERLVYWLAQGQARQRHDVSVVTVTGSEFPRSLELFPADIQVIKASDQSRYAELRAHAFDEIDSVLEESGWDLVHDHMGDYVTCRSEALAVRDQAVVVSCYGLLGNPHYDQIYRAIPVAKRLLPHLVVTVCSRDHRDHFKHLFTGDFIVRHAVPLRPLAQGEPRFVLYWAAVMPGKEQVRFARAMQVAAVPVVFAGPVHRGTPELDAYADAFHANVKDVSVEIGGASNEQALAIVARAHDSASCVYVGEVADLTLQHRLFAHADRFALCASHPEPFSLALLEGMSYGVPPVAGPFPSAREALDGIGSYVADLSEQQIVAAVRCPPPGRSEVQQYVRRRFSISQWLARWNEVYADALARSRRADPQSAYR